VRIFSCPSCGTAIAFGNSVCLTCGASLGFDRLTDGFAAWDARGAEVPAGGRKLRPCANLGLASCNWLAGPAAPGGLCDCCLLTRTRPDDGNEPALLGFARAEAAKRRLVYQLDQLGLPVVSFRDDAARGLGFDLLSSTSGPVVTGHLNGVVTIDVDESDDGHREALRARLEEPYRTLLGHFRHEIGHWYWTRLVPESFALDGFRALFGDEREEYAQALDGHYAGEPPRDWPESYVSAYAGAHPWEDWAETFAHYLHIHDTLQTAHAYEVALGGVTIDGAGADFDRLIEEWLPLTYALNAINRSMGRGDLYPFVLGPTVLGKLRLVHGLIRHHRWEPL
jgi:hypothetical protein